MNVYEEILKLTAGKLIHLHLGCGGRHIDNCVNIDLPQDQQFNLFKSAADISADILYLDFPTESIDSIQLHHVFEHFSCGVALGLLIKWNRWLKIKGTLLITTPDAKACCQGIGLLGKSLKDKMKLVRHIAGSHEEDKWSFHIDQWFKERFVHTLENLNFRVLEIKEYGNDNGTFDIKVLAEKLDNTCMSCMLENANELLMESTLHEVERPMLDIWYKKLLDIAYSGRS